MKSVLTPKIKKIIKEYQGRVELLEEKKNSLIKRIISAAEVGKLKRIRERLNIPK